ncbi:MAG: hypothetical protein P0111_04095 [Nitrospira sp.]|nr:hypothetical protein [Nitrospira sp.]
MQPPSSGIGQANAQLPTFPQKFEVQGPESDSFGFAVTQPGSIIVEVQGQGAPVLVTLESPGGQSITKQATGSLRMTYNVTSQDVQRNLFWAIQIRLAQPMPPQQGGRATGTVNVQHPPANSSQVRSALAAQQQAVQQQAAQQQAQAQQVEAQAIAQADQAFQQRKVQFQQQLASRRAAMIAQIQPQLSQLQNPMGGQVRHRGVEGTSPAADDPASDVTDEIGTRALKPAGGLKEAAIGVRPPVMSAMQEPVSSQQALGSAGSGPPPQQVMPNPTINSLSVGGLGQPSDQVIINGSGFGTNGGEVHFILGPNKDVTYTGQAWWYDNQILVHVPDEDKLRAYNGFVYVVRNPDKTKSSLTPFHFEPAVDFRTIIYTQDRNIGQPGADYKIIGGNSNLGHQEIRHGNDNPFVGYKGNDEFFTNARLANDWVLDEVFLTPTRFKRGGAYFQEKKLGSNWPYFNVRFWVDGCFGDTESFSKYIYIVSIRGPKGVPDGLVCTQAPCP